MSPTLLNSGNTKHIQRIIQALAHGRGVVRILTRRFTGRGVSVVISVLLLIVITVSASALFYAYSVGLMGSLLPPPQQQGNENPVIENIAFSTDGAALLTVRNIGSADSKVGSIYVDGVLKYSNPQGALISAGQAQTFTLPSVSSIQHNFSVRTLDGGGVGVYGPQNIYFVGTTTGTATITGTSTITRSSTTATTTGTYTTTYTTTYTSTFTNNGPTTMTTTTASTWTSTNPSTYSTTNLATQTITSQSSVISTLSTCTDGSTWPCNQKKDRLIYTTTSLTTITSTSTGSATQTVTTSILSTGTTSQTSTITSTGTSSGTTTVTSTVRTTTSALSPLWLSLFMFLPWPILRSRLRENSVPTVTTSLEGYGRKRNL